MFGVINIYKPKGLTSHDVVGIVRKILNIKQVGHTGTLDPFAEGVLPICIGKATRLIEYFDDDKEYIATIKFGVSTDTYDTEGKVTQRSTQNISEEEIRTCLKKFLGEVEQIPPIFSAIKVNGKKLYEYARAGEKITPKSRKVTIYNINLMNFNYEEQTANVLISCSKGTYIRSIANDLGTTLGCGAHLIKLIRTQAGKHRIENSATLPIKLNSETKKYTIDDNAEEFLTKYVQDPINSLSIEKIEISDNEYNKVKHGNAIKINNPKFKSGDFLILIYNKHIIAIGQYIESEIKVKKVFE